MQRRNAWKRLGEHKSGTAQRSTTIRTRTATYGTLPCGEKVLVGVKYKLGVATGNVASTLVLDRDGKLAAALLNALGDEDEVEIGPTRTRATLKVLRLVVIADKVLFNLPKALVSKLDAVQLNERQASCT